MTKTKPKYNELIPIKIAKTHLAIALKKQTKTQQSLYLGQLKNKNGQRLYDNKTIAFAIGTTDKSVASSISHYKNDTRVQKETPKAKPKPTSVKPTKKSKDITLQSKQKSKAVTLKNKEPRDTKPVSVVHEEVEHHEHKEYKDDKIFNNSYYHGDKLRGEEYEFARSLAVDTGFASRYLNDIYDVENNINYKMVQTEIMHLMDTNEELRSIINDPKKKKFNKDIINKIFSIIYSHLSADRELVKFVDLIYVFDCVSNISGLKYNNLFDLLSFDYKKMLVLELDKKYNVLKRFPNSSSTINMF